MTIRIQEFELWGNFKDGFDCNNASTILTVQTIEDLPDDNEIFQMFSGKSFPLNENSFNSLPVASKHYSIDWADDMYADICYKDQPIGSITVT
jgi:hypothetical protein